jgi:outer membrane protein
MKNLFTIIALTILSLGLFAQKSTATTEAIKLGYINVDSVLIKLKEYPTQVKILEAFQKQLTAEFEVKNLEFETKYKDFQEKEKSFSEDVKKSKIEELQTLDQELSKMRQDANQKIAQKERDLLVPLNEKIIKAIEIVAKAKGYSHITDRKNFYFVSPSFDVTAAVTEEANKL